MGPVGSPTGGPRPACSCTEGRRAGRKLSSLKPLAFAIGPQKIDQRATRLRSGPGLIRALKLDQRQDFAHRFGFALAQVLARLHDSHGISTRCAAR